MSAEKRCEHVELRRAKTGGWFCIGADCDFSIPEPVEPCVSTEIERLRAENEALRTGFFQLTSFAAQQLASVTQRVRQCATPAAGMNRTSKTKLRMSAYYYDFAETGIPEIDKILSAVACAGKAYHGTENWNDDCEPYPGHTGATPIDWIWNAAQEAAAAWRARAQVETGAKPRKCMADMYADPPRDCNAPYCGCNPAWSECIEMLQEIGWKSPEELRKPARDGAPPETSAESVSLDYRLPCDVRLPPSTTIGKGCTLSTLMNALKLREDGTFEFTDERARSMRGSHETEAEREPCVSHQALKEWERMFDAWVKHQAGLSSEVPLWPNPEWSQDVAMVARALARPTSETPSGPFLVADGGSQGEHRFRTMKQGMSAWTLDPDEALQFARRKDAELFAAEDEDAWCILPVPKQAKASEPQCICATTAEPLRHVDPQCPKHSTRPAPNK